MVYYLYFNDFTLSVSPDLFSVFIEDLKVNGFIISIVYIDEDTSIYYGVDSMQPRKYFIIGKVCTESSDLPF